MKIAIIRQTSPLKLLKATPFSKILLPSGQNCVAHIQCKQEPSFLYCPIKRMFCGQQCTYHINLPSFPLVRRSGIGIFTKFKCETPTRFFGLDNFYLKIKLGNKLQLHLFYLHPKRTRFYSNFDWLSTCQSVSVNLHVTGFLTILTGGCLRCEVHRPPKLTTRFCNAHLLCSKRVVKELKMKLS